MDDGDVDARAAAPRSIHDAGRIVVRVVDDDELGVNAGERLVEAVDERADDRLLVARRRDDRDLGNGRWRNAVPSVEGRFRPSVPVLSRFPHGSPP